MFSFIKYIWCNKKIDPGDIDKRISLIESVLDRLINKYSTPMHSNNISVNEIMNELKVLKNRLNNIKDRSNGKEGFIK